MNEERMHFADGKYVVICNNGLLTALRNGEPWNRDLTGDNLVYWMFVEAKKLESDLYALRSDLKIANKVNYTLHKALSDANQELALARSTIASYREREQTMGWDQLRNKYSEHKSDG